ncbi:MAG TPA: class I SAM-dependent methyltransferase [Acidimicrobiia bacterium]
MSPEILSYIVGHSSPLPSVATDLMAETMQLGDSARMQVSPDEGLFLRALVRITGAKQVLEIGTFTGFSALMMASGGAEKVVCLDVSDEWTSIARRYWKAAGLDQVIELRIGPGADTLRAMPEQETFDLVFIDADKPSYPTYFELTLPRLRAGGLIAVDNTLWSGRVLDDGDTTENTAAIRQFNDLVAADKRVETAIVPISDGVTLIWKRP